ncbi:hypothetical protein M8C21_003045 [Ambrosia artemisiifolia]|uniref:H15 domain-containing protein n=1 Tax=Ambrosia artemisiifolia TaxID=4212 RepID=A0AAD5CYS5_AMBAR|nr:hypothetical protein M8C21_003045 [Ambrosia artemisiifolia]
MASSATGDATTNPPAPAPVNVLPQYPELIMEAIDTLDVKKGVCRSKISKQIESSYGSLPAAHKTLLSHHLNRMRATGELIVINNNYLKPDPNAPLRRGRGRPRKPPSEFSPRTSVSGRKPGRPRLYDTPAKKPASGEGRGRGRPRKVITDADGMSAAPVAMSALVSFGSRGRGRPRKEPRSDDDDVMSVMVSGEKRGRGRPRKDGGSGGRVTSVTASGEKRGRGRPKKVMVTEVVVGMD